MRMFVGPLAVYLHREPIDFRVGCGGKPIPYFVNLPGSGLSPRARGKLVETGARIFPTRPIPASAGETKCTPRNEAGRRAYPRERRGNYRQVVHFATFAGLSPRARGKQKPEPHLLDSGGPIPASAGETIRK